MARSGADRWMLLVALIGWIAACGTGEPVGESAAGGASKPVDRVEVAVVPENIVQLDADLLEAVGQEDLKAVRRLLEEGAHVNINDEKGRTGLHRAALAGNLELGTYLMDQGAYINAFDQEHCMPLHMAARAGHLEMARRLVERGASVNAPAQDGHTALDAARDADHQEVVEFLLTHQAESGR